MEQVTNTGYPHLDKPWMKFYDEKYLDVPFSRDTIYDFFVKNSQCHLSSVATDFYGYRISYSNVQVNFQCSFEDLSDIILLSLKSNEDINIELKNLEKLVYSGMTSISKLTRELNLKPLYIFALSRRSEKLSVMGQRLKIIEHKEEK